MPSWFTSIRGLATQRPLLWTLAGISLILCMCGTLPTVGPLSGNAGVILASGLACVAAWRRGLTDCTGKCCGWYLLAVFHVGAVIVQTAWMLQTARTPGTPVDYQFWRLLAASSQFFMAGLLLWLATKTRRAWLQRFMDAMTIGAALSVILWVVAIGPTALAHEVVVRLVPTEGVELSQRVVLCWGVLTLVSAAISVVTDRWQQTPETKVLAGGIILSSVGLVGMALQSNDRQFINVGLLATLLAAQKLAVVWGTSLPRQEPSEADPLARPTMSYVAYGALGIAATVDVATKGYHPTFDPVSHGLIAYMTVMVIGRSHLTMIRNVELLKDLATRELELSKQAFQDDLTGLANRRKFGQLLEELLEARKSAGSEAVSDETGRQIHVAYLDLDGFKEVNDTFGHPVGDAVLKCVADRLRTHASMASSIARLSGDEFGCVFDCDVDVEDIMGKVVKAIAMPMHIEGVTQPIQLSTSAGLARWLPGQPATPKQLLRQADTALYCAKNAGRNQVQSCVESIGRSIPQQPLPQGLSSHHNADKKERRANRQ